MMKLPERQASPAGWTDSSSSHWLDQPYLFLLIQNDPSLQDELRLLPPWGHLWPFCFSEVPPCPGAGESRSRDPDLANGASLERWRRCQAELDKLVQYLCLFGKGSWCRWYSLILQVFRKAENFLSLTCAFQTQIRGNFLLVTCCHNHGLLTICTERL